VCTAQAIPAKNEAIRELQDQIDKMRISDELLRADVAVLEEELNDMRRYAHHAHKHIRGLDPRCAQWKRTYSFHAHTRVNADERKCTRMVLSFLTDSLESGNEAQYTCCSRGCSIQHPSTLVAAEGVAYNIPDIVGVNLCVLKGLQSAAAWHTPIVVYRAHSHRCVSQAQATDLVAVPHDNARTRTAATSQQTFRNTRVLVSCVWYRSAEGACGSWTRVSHA